MNKTLKQQVKADIKSSTYSYYENTDLCFQDYVYGDIYYVTLEDVIYRFLTTYDTDLEFDYMLGNIDVDPLVNALYLHFIRTDKKFKQNYEGSTERHRKNYIMTSLRNATEPLLVKQFKENEVIAKEFYEFNDFKKFNYISIYSKEGSFLEDLSYYIWEKEKSKKDDIEIQIDMLAEIFRFLNPLQRKVVYMVLKNREYSEIASRLQIDQDKVRKILYFATEKLKARHSFKRRSA